MKWVQSKPSATMVDDQHYMKLALQEARIAFDEDEIPIGSIVVVSDRVIARGRNMTEKLNDPTAHAEMIALTSAFSFLSAKYLPGATLYVTVEPCLMCAGAMYWSKVARVVWGAPDEKNGFQRITGESCPFHPKTSVTNGVLADECAALMKDFFKQKR
jgi:tRNA(adenine34) deaminase